MALAMTRVFTLLLPASTAFAQIASNAISRPSNYFIERCTGEKLSESLVDANGMFQFDSGSIRRIGNEASESRNRQFITSARSDFLSANWTYEITFKAPLNAPDDILSIGFGEGVPDHSFYNEPKNSVYFHFHQGKTGWNNGWRVDIISHSTGYFVYPYKAEGIGYLPPGSKDGIFTARISKKGDVVTFSVPGTKITHTIKNISAAAPFLSPSNTRLFFGSSSSAYSYCCITSLPVEY